MAFSFFGNYSKPGPGVSKDEPQKPPFIRFWVIFFRKWTKFIQLNWLFLIPLVLVGVLFYCINRFTPYVWICGIPVIILFPFWGGLTYVLRNYAREEHAFVWGDFKDAAKENAGKLLINGAITYVLLFIVSYAIQFYSYVLRENQDNWFFYIPLALSITLAALFLFAQYYIPLMVVTFDLKLKQIYKNAFIFAIIGLWRNLFLTIVLGVWILLHVLAFFLMGWPLLLALLFFLLLDFSLICYLINFTIYPLVEKMIIKPYYEKQAAEKAAAEGSTEQLSTTEGEETQPSAENGAEEAPEEKKPEYVFVNGKLVRRVDTDDEEQVFEDHL